MSRSAPWSYQQQNKDPGGVKLFNPAQFTEQANQPNQFNPAAQDAHSAHQPAEVFNGHPEQYNTGHDPNWNWNYSQSDPTQMAQDPNTYGQVYDPNQSQAVGQDNGYGSYYYDQNQGQWVPTYGQYDQSYDPDQANYQENMVHGQQDITNTEAQSGNFDPSYNHYHGNYGYTDPGASESAGTHVDTFSDGQHPEQVTDQSVDSENLDQSSTSQGMSGFFQNDDYESESNTGTCDNSAHGSSLQNSFNQIQQPVPAEDVMKPEISSESLQTVNFSTGSLDTGMVMNSVIAPHVQQVTDHFQQISVSDQEQPENLKHEETNTPAPPSGNDVNQSAMHGQVHSTGNVSENVSGGSPHSDDQQGLSDWEVVPSEPSRMLEVPGGDIRPSQEEALDSNVQFFIGSSKNSDDGSARHTPETAPQVFCCHKIKQYTIFRKKIRYYLFISLFPLFYSWIVMFICSIVSQIIS